MTKEPNVLLELSDAEIEDVMAAVQLWCRRFGVAMASDRGQEAMRRATVHRKDANLTVRQLLRLLMQEL